jgi:hypothetical protein
VALMFAIKIPLVISAAVAGAYSMPLSTNQMLLVAQAIFGICVSFALFMVVLRSVEHNPRDSREPAHPVGVGGRARRYWRRAGRYSKVDRGQ